MLKPVAAFDVAKEKSTLCVLSPSNDRIVDGLDILHTTAGFKHVLSLLAKVEKKYRCRPACIMEATGHYHRPLFDTLQEAGYEITLVNPIQSDAVQNIGVRGAKTDPIDAYHLALLYRLNIIKPEHVPEEIILEIRSMCRHYFSLGDTLTEYKLRVRSLLDQLFPYFKKAFSDPFGSGARLVMKHLMTIPNPLKADLEIMTLPLAKSSSRSIAWARNKLALLSDSIKIAPGVRTGRDALVLMLISDLAIIEAIEGQIVATEKQISQKADGLPEYSYLMTIPGMGPITAATILGEIGSVDRFKNSKQLTAFAGLDPRVRQSGKFRGSRSKISKRGSPYLRRVLFLLAMASIRKKPNKQPTNNVIKQYYEIKLEHGKAKMVALVAVMHKLVNYIFAVLRDKAPFIIRSIEEIESLVA